MHHWLIVVPKSQWAMENAISSIREFVLPKLKFVPEGLCLHTLDNSCILLSAWANARLFSYSQPEYLTDNEFCVVSGLPTLEAYTADPHADIPSTVATELLQKGAHHLFLNLGGNWNFGHYIHKRVQVLSSFSGYNSCFYLENSDYFVVGNRASLVATFGSRSGKLTYNKAALSWLFSTTMILGEETPFRGVKKLKPGTLLKYSTESGVSLEHFTENFYSPLVFGDETQRSEFLERTIQRLSERIGWYVKRGIPISTHLTGGKDTRAVLSLLLASGAIENIQKVISMGSAENGDVIVAKQIAAATSLGSKHVVVAGGKGKERLDLQEVINRFYFSAFKYEGQLTPYDGAIKPARSKRGEVTLMGGGGEIYRQKQFQNHTDTESIFRQFLNWTYKYNVLAILTDDAVAAQHRYLRAEAQKLLDEGIVNHHIKFYIDHRLSNWGCGHMQNNPSPSLAALIDIDLCRLMFTSVDMGEEVHFEILRHCYPGLLNIPFLNDYWKGVTHVRAVDLGVDVPPLQLPTAHNFPWQFEFYREHRDELIDIAIDGHALFEEYVSREALLKLKQSPIEPFNSANIKMLFGLVMALILVSDSATGRWDFEGCHTTFSYGNLSAKVGPDNLQLMAEKVAEPVVAWGFKSILSSTAH